MSETAARVRKRATYADLEALPDNVIGEILNGELYASPRPGLRHSMAATRVTGCLSPMFDDALGGPGGWSILVEPELHFGEDVAVPDLAGLRRERVPAIPDEPHLALAPDWVCEILSPSTERNERSLKLSIYARENISHAWLVNPAPRTLEVLRLGGEEWLIASVYSEADAIRAESFAAIGIDLKDRVGTVLAQIEETLTRRERVGGAIPAREPAIENVIDVEHIAAYIRREISDDECST